MNVSFLDAQLTKEALERSGERLRTYHTLLKTRANATTYDAPECSLHVPYDKSVVEEVMACATSIKTDTLTTVIVVGIGGSSLGAKAVYDALGGHYAAIATTSANNEIQKTKPKIFFAETIDALQLDALVNLIQSTKSMDELALVVVSKSGTTMETLFDAEILLQGAFDHFGKEASKRIVVISDTGSTLLQEAKEHGMHTLMVPKVVGGRFSIFTAAGLLPLALAGITISELVRGAKESLDAALSHEINPASTMAQWLYLHAQEGRDTHNMFAFVPQIESLCKWYRQLLAESIGKQNNTKGNESRVGILPIVSIGSTDLHATAQLYLGGPNSMVTTFISSNFSSDVSKNSQAMSSTPLFSKAGEFLSGKHSHEVLQAILDGTKASYRHNNLSFIELVFDEISPREIGAFMQLHMLMIMYLGVLFEIHTFDQPSVEGYKQETRRLLQQP